MELQVFTNEQFGQVQLVEINGEPWFVGKEIAEILGYKKPLDALSRHVDEDDSVKHGLTDNLGRTQETIIINESGLYSLILKSKLTQAKQFKRWVTSEVLPSIRKHGAYMTEQTLEQALTSPDFLIRLANELKEEKERSRQLEAEKSILSVENMVMKPKADYFDDLVDRNLLTSFRETAKQLKVKERRFIQFLLDKKYVYRDKKGKLMPFADKNNGLFEVKESVNEKTNWAGTQTLITPKGRETFRLLFI
ncbi:phage repressor protein/antirepressor Ant [Streptococcus agalactiae]|uniref:BRO family protein n=1 Tax=Streptococcus agalactiae TaxID=1311 RepID=UPI000B655685|nr:BRO family protein [Streptococcus agalactiae]OTG48012.1 phage repressor protein/antirepressor Ant [Streptococcus agalactiae]RRA72852.1 phage repressor protein/antirepressor Ant [Streptococcus agalactiae]HEK9992461.1 phage antirepressor KilAC domain-containing protein [Streptococcus equi subsp. zooepidemicus]